MSQPVATVARYQGSETPARVVRCYVADPDFLARHLLSDAISRDTYAEVIGTTDDERTMLRDIEEVRPDAVFVDARMLSDVTRAGLRNHSARGCCIIFVSALASDASSAFTCDAIDFLLRPASRARVENALERVRHRLEEHALLNWARVIVSGDALRHDERNQPESLVRAPDTREIVVVESRGGTEYVPGATIDAIVSAGYMAHIITASRVIETSASLYDIEARLDPAYFIRTHRSSIVNMRRARRLDMVSRGCGLLALESGRTVPVSRRRISAVRLALREHHTLGTRARQPTSA
ncbi:MAG: LytTR family DNA-binding domain-containing protein [bacterium]